VQAIEAYYTRKYESTYTKMDMTVVISQLKGVIDAFSELAPFKEAISKKLEYINHKSLRTILKELTTDAEIFSGFIKDKREFVDKVVDARNYLTHYESSKNGVRNIGMLEMIQLVENLRFLVTSIILREIGFEKKEIANSISLYCRDRIIALYPLDNNRLDIDQQYS
jgi:hypothetical protein